MVKKELLHRLTKQHPVIHSIGFMCAWRNEPWNAYKGEYARHFKTGWTWVVQLDQIQGRYPFFPRHRWISWQMAPTLVDQYWIGNVLPHPQEQRKSCSTRCSPCASNRFRARKEIESEKTSHAAFDAEIEAKLGPKAKPDCVWAHLCLLGTIYFQTMQPDHQQDWRPFRREDT